MTDTVVLGFVDGHIPFVLTRVDIATMRCVIPVVPGGDGATTEPLAVRTSRCHHPTHYLIGSAPTCEHHIRASMTLMNPDPLSPRADRIPAWVEPCVVAS